ncbi:LLM class flavin-dependent oxidoreductase [Pseudonocardia sp. DSM 110487]|uniref:LLM class flavin-dependent oxidoreductase n=1 Tax=Pseudonocardia sp. DSM 110487 TaxID=2865833 RepID=UPI001C699BBF|nr:LLM class flavin-dependent oxidoreductase [Pseudonocardia sp. DSM 110487]QYN36601.1 LLM class flavin-dependent oxidoreductase [Pseudonocardia sp. DSM 110487]
MRFGIGIPQFFGDGEFDFDAFRTFLRRAEELGFESGWTQEQVLGPSSQLSALETMTYAAACTERLRVGCAVFVTTLHNPVHLAKSLATLDQLSGGRLDVGVGSGGPRGGIFPAFGLPPERYIARFTEGLALMKALWTEDPVTFKGEFWQVENGGMHPKPFQKPHPPIWMGGSAEAALRRAVRLGTGFFGAGSSPNAVFAEQVRTVRQLLADSGRDAGSYPIAKRIYTLIDDDADRARTRMNDALASIYGARIEAIESAAVAGTPADLVRGVREAIDAGAELVLFTQVGDPAEQMERLAAEVIPQLG